MVPPVRVVPVSSEVTAADERILWGCDGGRQFFAAEVLFNRVITPGPRYHRGLLRGDLRLVAVRRMVCLAQKVSCQRGYRQAIIV